MQPDLSRQYSAGGLDLQQSASASASASASSQRHSIQGATGFGLLDSPSPAADTERLVAAFNPQRSASLPFTGTHHQQQDRHACATVPIDMQAERQHQITGQQAERILSPVDEDDEKTSNHRNNQQKSFAHQSNNRSLNNNTTSQSNSSIASATPRIWSYQDFNQKMKQQSCIHLSRQLKQFVSDFAQRRWLSGDPSVGTSRTVQETRQSLHNELQSFADVYYRLVRQHAAFADASSDELDNVAESIEKYMCHALYGKIFGCFLQERYEDSRLQQRLQQLAQFIRPSHLDLPDDAQQYMRLTDYQAVGNAWHMMSHHKSAREKLQCLMTAMQSMHAVLQKQRQQYVEQQQQAQQQQDAAANCDSLAPLAAHQQQQRKSISSNSVSGSDSPNSSLSLGAFDADSGDAERDTEPQRKQSVTTASSDAASAQSVVRAPAISQSRGLDDLFPLLVLLLLRFRPKHLLLHLNFIQLMRHEDRLCGEANYWFVTLQSAAEFLLTASGGQFQMPEDEFQRRLNEAAAASAAASVASSQPQSAHSTLGSTKTSTSNHSHSNQAKSSTAKKTSDGPGLRRNSQQSTASVPRCASHKHLTSLVDLTSTDNKNAESLSCTSNSQNTPQARRRSDTVSTSHSQDANSVDSSIPLSFRFADQASHASMTSSDVAQLLDEYKRMAKTLLEWQTKGANASKTKGQKPSNSKNESDERQVQLQSRSHPKGDLLSNSASKRSSVDSSAAAAAARAPSPLQALNAFRPLH